MRKLIFLPLISALAVSSFAGADWDSNENLEFRADIKGVCGIDVKENGSLSFQGASEGKAGIFEVRHNQKYDATVTITTHDVSPNLTADKVLYSATANGAKSSNLSDEITIPVERKDTVEVHARYDDLQDNVLAGEAKVVTEVTIRCS